jgi:hypothetical protein
MGQKGREVNRRAALSGEGIEACVGAPVRHVAAISRRYAFHLISIFDKRLCAASPRAKSD